MSTPGDDAKGSLSFFDASRVPVETIELSAETGDLPPEAYEIVSHKVCIPVELDTDSSSSWTAMLISAGQ